MTERYLEDGKLSVLTNEILQSYKGSELNDAKAFEYRIIFTNGSLGHQEVAGRCTKVHGAIRYLWSNDFVILIQKKEFDAMTPVQKTRILVHELHHIGKDEHDEPTIRRHDGDFCEIDAHDKLCYKIAHEIYRGLKNLKEFTRQEEMDVPPVTVLAEE